MTQKKSTGFSRIAAYLLPIVLVLSVVVTLKTEWPGYINENALAPKMTVEEKDMLLEEDAPVEPDNSSRGQVQRDPEPEENGETGKIYQEAMGKGTSVFYSGESDQYTNIFKMLWNWIVSLGFADPKNILVYQMPVMRGAALEEQRVMEVSSRYTPEDEEEIYLQPEEEAIPEEIKLEIERIQDDQKPAIVMSGEGPQILIYHTHTTEAYAQIPEDKYVETAEWRTNESMHNVLRVGEELTKLLKANEGIEAIHVTKNHEPTTGGYSRSEATVKEYMEKYPSLKMFIDIHRNHYPPGSKKREDEVVIIDGKPVARIMVVIGTGNGKTGAGWAVRPKWQENYTLALKLCNSLNEMHPGLAKEIDVKTGRYNQHLSTAAILIEVGSTLCTRDEALRAMPYLAKAIHNIME